MPGTSSTGERSGAVVIPQCVGGSPGPTDSERIGSPVVPDGQLDLCDVRRLRLLERDGARVRRPQRTRLRPQVTCGEVSERARVDDLVDGLLDQVLEVQAIRLVPHETHHVSDVAVVHQRGPCGDRAGDHHPARLEPAIACGDDRDVHPLIDPEPSEPLRHDDVDRFRRLNGHDVALDHVHDLRDPVCGGQFLRQDRDGCLLDGIDAGGTRPRREHAQDAAPRPDVEDDVARTHDRLDRTLEGLGADLVPDHRPVYLELRIHRVGRDPDRRPHLPTIGSFSPSG
jgi:hypothetical protein